MNDFVRNLIKPHLGFVNSFFSMLILGIITFVVYFPTLFNDFTNWDDKTHLLENPAVLSLHPENIVRIFTGIVNKTYIPFTTLSFAFEYHFIGFNSFYYHLDNLLLHIGVVVLIFLFLKDLLGSSRAAFIAAAIFALHPMRVESISWVTERKDVLYSFFYMAAVWMYCLYVRRQRWWLFAMALCFGLLSILSKAMALSLPLVLLICDWILQRPRNRWLILDKIPFLLFIVPITWITYSLHVRVPGQNWVEGFLIWIWSFAFYLEKFFWPFPLVPLYSVPYPVNISNFSYLQSVLFCLLIIFLLLRFKKKKYFLLSFVWFFASIFFLLRYDTIDGSIVADRFMYLPSLGICAFLGLSFDTMLLAFKESKIRLWASYMGLLLLLIVLSFETNKQIYVWRDGLSLWNYVIDKNPNIDTPYNNRGDIYIRLKKYDLAQRDFDRSIAILPEREDEYFNRGVLFTRVNKLNEATEDFLHALQINSKYIKAWNNLGVVYFQQGKVAEAIGCFSKALSIDPTYAQEYYNRGIVYEKIGKSDAAFNEYSLAIKFNPNFVLAYSNRGNLYMQQEEFSKALSDYKRALDIDPKFAPAQVNFDKLNNMLNKN